MDNKKANVIEPYEGYRHPTADTPWKPVPLVRADMKKRGITGGEGCQWPVYITASETDENLAFMGTDVGGMYRTVDGGKNWAMSTVGIYSSAAGGIAIDPCNSKRVICIGCNSTYWNVNGIYRSENGGESWIETYTYRLTGDDDCKICGHRDFRHQVAFDRSSFDSEAGYCKIVYWCTETLKYNKGECTDARLYKSTDGGVTWKMINSSEDIGGGEIFVSPAKGYVYIANVNGVFRSTDGGMSFSKVLDIPSFGMDVASCRPDSLFVSSREGMYISNDNGETFTRVDKSGYPAEFPARVRVSPADPDYMVLQNDKLTLRRYTKVEDCWSGKNYYSHDGGVTWHECGRDISDSFIPYNTRQTVFAWNGKDRNICYSTGGDMIMRSDDGGANFRWGANGYNGACAAALTCNLNRPELMYAGNQDYCGAYSTDAGETWTYVNWTGYEWGGFSYGGYVLDENTVIAVPRDKGIHKIALTRDGGKTVTVTDIAVKSPRVIGVRGNNDIVFAGNYRSLDRGETWQEMDGCLTVYCSSPDGSVFGKNGENQIVRSDDFGKSWRVLADSVGKCSFTDYDIKGDRLIVLYNENAVYQLDTDGGALELISDFSDYRDRAGGPTMFRQVAVDPENSNAIYISNAKGVYSNPSGMLRTLDGGKTWEVLTRNVGDSSEGADGGRSADHLALNHVTRELFESGGCRGIYKIRLAD